jgi:hypothetical protein
MDTADAVPAARRKWPSVHVLLALPGVLAGIGGAMFWAATLAGRMGLGTLWRGFEAILGFFVLAGAALAVYGFVFALPLGAIAFILAVIKSVRRRADERGCRAAWVWIGLSAAGCILGMSVLGQLR